ncbi:hypothetical protein C8F04DRAFT_1273921 [Mycena alexandri]|uniref:Uncharacterized protein n=1 Tax=Mycena alexandri TaxID=1745969 RepID=A0AAD6S5N9_9AGAR|nr:hypothetical protein C8F04DRAFT_1273921 [Mycena alexandri]
MYNLIGTDVPATDALIIFDEVKPSSDWQCRCGLGKSEWLENVIKWQPGIVWEGFEGLVTMEKKQKERHRKGPASWCIDSRKRLTPEEAKLERQQKLAAEVANGKKPGSLRVRPKESGKGQGREGIEKEKLKINIFEYSTAKSSKRRKIEEEEGKPQFKTEGSASHLSDGAAVVLSDDKRDVPTGVLSIFQFKKQHVENQIPKGMVPTSSLNSGIQIFEARFLPTLMTQDSVAPRPTTPNSAPSTANADKRRKWQEKSPGSKQARLSRLLLLRI